MKFEFSAYCEVKTKSSKKIHVSSPEIYSFGNDESEQKEVEAFIKQVGEFTKAEFIKHNPKVKSCYLVSFCGNVLKGGKVKDITEWNMDEYSNEELVFANKLVKDAIRQEKALELEAKEDDSKS